MKKFTLQLLFLFFSISGYSQLALEGFESTTGPDPLPSTNWTLGTGNWAVFDNGIGTFQRWGIGVPPAAGTNCARVDREQIGQGNTSEDYLSTPEVLIPTNGELRFFTRMLTSGNQNTIYQVKVALSSAAQADPASYILVQQWTELDLILPVLNFNVYTEKVVNLSAFAGQLVYVSFVKVFTQPGPGLFGDSWLIDNVQIDAPCLTPTGLTFNTITSNTATLNWTNPNGIVTGWEIEVIPASGTPTGIPTHTATTPPFLLTNLTPNTAYKYYVRAICTSGFRSPWSVASANFTTLVAPPVCGGNYVDPGGIAGNYANNITPLTTVPTIIPAINPGEVVTITFTSFNTELNNDVLRIYNGTVSPANLIGAFSGTTLPPVITSSAPDGSLTFVFTSNNTITAAGWTSNITCGVPPLCPKPIALTTTGLTPNSVSLGYTATGTAASWQVLALPCAAPGPTAATTGFITTIDNPYLFTNLISATCYNLYVRSDCGGGVLSDWSLPTNVTTLVLPPVCGGNYVDDGGLAANYLNSITAANGTRTVTPNAGEVVTVTFTAFATELTNDVLSIYNGPVLPANLIGSFSGTTLPPVITSSAPDGSLTFVFTSNGSVTAAGWVSNITCGIPPSCATPLALTTSNLVASSVSLGWTSTGATAPWQVLVLPCTAPEPTAATTGWEVTSLNPFPVTGLAGTTCYRLYVRTDCTATTGGTSNWSLPVTINTPCASYTVPFQEGFNTGSPSVQCWKVLNTNGDTDQWVLNSTLNPFEGNQCAAITTDFNAGANNDWLISPQIILTANQRLKFHYRVQSAGEPNEFRVMLSTTGSNPADFTQTLVPLTTYSNIAYIERKVNISAFSGPVYIAWHVPPGTIDGWRIFIDNVIVENLPICPEPENVIASNVTSSAVTLSWTNGNLESAWEVLALPCGSPTPTAASIGESAGTNPFTLSTLLPNTCYDIYVRAVCSATEKSIWTVATRINTLCLPFNVPFQEGFNSTSTTQACWTVLNVNNDFDAWNLNYAPNPFEGNESAAINTDFNGGANNDWLISPQIVLNGNQRLRYRYRVESTFEPNEFRVMLSTTGTAPASFTTTLVPLATYNNITYVERTVSLTGITGNANIGFHIPPGTLDGWRLYIDRFIIETNPTCFPPINLITTDISPTSAVLGWTDTNTIAATQWEIIIVPQGSPEPLPSATGAIVGANPSPVNGLLPGTAYSYYVRVVCSPTDSSEWSLASNFTTLIINDNCSGAIFTPVNSTAACQQVTAGTITGATASLPAPTAPCIGGADDDVWFQFIASNPFLTVQLLNIVGSTTNLNFGVYSGACGTLTQIFCSAAGVVAGTVNNLTIGQTYFIRVYSNGNAAQTVNFNLCISTPASCLSGQSACQNLNYQNTTGVTSQGTIGCLFSSPNPSYYTINVTATGPINLLLTQSTTQGGLPNLDVDYAAWGPFTDQIAACAAIGNPITLAPGIGVPVTLTTGCSFSAAPIENLNIVNAVAGQIYVILITNFANQPGFVNLTQTNTNSPTAGTYECCPSAFFKYTPVSYCRVSGIANPIPTIDTGSLAGTFSSTPGLVFANPATGEINLLASTAGNYVVTNTVTATATCAQTSKTYTISISEPTVANISYVSPSYCKTLTTLQPVTQTGTPIGTYSALPNIGLSINPATGDINPSLSSPGVYNVVYGLPGSICTVGNPSTQVEILALPNIIQPAPVIACFTHTLPTLAVGNYYSQTGGVGPLDATVPITTSQTIYIYAVGANGCSNEKSFPITINTVPAATFTATPSACTPADGTITVNSPTDGGGALPADLFISEVTDAAAGQGSLSYVEIFNGTGAPVNLANYKIRVFNFGTNPTTPNICNIPLSAVTLNNNSTYVVALGSATNLGGVTPNQVNAGCGDVDNNDSIRLTTSTDVLVDLWGTTDGSVFTPSGQPGYTYRRLTTATVPSTTWNPANWEILDPENYSLVGSYPFTGSVYQYSVVSGVFQTGTTFTGLAAGDYPLVVRNIITGCLSAPVTVTVGLTNPIPTVTGFEYPTPVCKNATTNPLPINFAPGFTTGGTYSEVLTISTGLVFINTSTGEIDLINSSSGSHTVRYLVPINPATCQAEGSFDFEIVINPTIIPVIGFSYTTPICQNVQATLLPAAPGLSSFATFSATPTGLVFVNTSTGEINLETSTPGVYDIIVTVLADAASCREGAITSSAFQFEIKPVVNLITAFSYDTPFCATNGSETPNLAAGFATGGTYSSTAGLLINSSTGAINLTSTPGTYTITYTATPNVANCETATSGTTQVTIVAPVAIAVTGGCQSVSYILTAAPVSGSFNPETATFSWENASGITVGNTQNVTITTAGTYTVTVTVNGCATKSLPLTVDAVFCVIQKGISVNNDGLNDTFNLSGYDVKKLTLFNRLGRTVYSRNNYVNEWGGLSDNGDELPDATYYYIIERNNGETKTGWIYINRAQ